MCPKRNRIYILCKYIYNNLKGIVQMKLIFLIVIIFVLTMSLFNYLTYKRKKDNYLEAGKKWDGIVKELSKRK